nr:hypothetical protein [Tanacetum cinerariifolium]
KPKPQLSVVPRQPWCCCGGGATADEVMMMVLGWWRRLWTETKGVAARGGEWCGGSSRSGE